MPKYTPDSSLPELQWKEPKGPWHVRKAFTVIKEGRKVRVFKGESLRTKNKVEARKKALEILAKWGATVSTTAVIELFRDGAQAYEDSRKNDAQATQDSIMYSRKHLDPYFGPRRIDDIVLNHWVGYVTARRAESPDVALFNEWKTFTGIMNLMHAEGHRRLPLTVPNPDEGRERNDTVLSEDELESWFREMNPTTQLQASMIHDLLMRPIEVKRLERVYVDFTVTTLPNGEKVFGKIRITTKSSKGKKIKAREIPMSREIWSGLQVYLAARDKRCLREYGRKSKYVFHAKGDLDNPVGDFGKAFELARQRAGFKTHATPYTIRHTAITNAYRRAQAEVGFAGSNSISPTAVMISIMAGHSIQTAIKNYLHLKSVDLTGVLRVAGGVGGRHISGVGMSGNGPGIASN